MPFVALVWTEEQQQLMRELYAAGMSDYKVAERLGCSYDVARKWRCRLKIAYVHREQEDARLRKRSEELTALLKEGKSYEQIGEVYGVSRSTVAGWIFRMEEDLKKTIAKPKQHIKAIVAPEVDRKFKDPGSSRLDDRNLKIRILKGKPPSLEKVKLDGEPRARKLSTLDLEKNDCRWVHGDPKNDHHYCGHAVKPGSSYCDFHHGICYTPGTEGPMLGRRIVNNAVVASSIRVRHVLR